jgi:hypothetical protein
MGEVKKQEVKKPLSSNKEEFHKMQLREHFIRQEINNIYSVEYLKQRLR